METGQDIKFNKRLAWILRTAVTIAFFLTLTGYTYLLAIRTKALPSPDLLRLFPPSKWHDPAMIMTAIGVLGFILVPVSRVVYSAFYFSAKKDHWYAFLSFYVLLMIGVGILVGAAG